MSNLWLQVVRFGYTQILVAVVAFGHWIIAQVDKVLGVA